MIGERAAADQHIGASASAVSLASAAEAAVVALAVVGDAHAFEELVRRRQGVTRGFLRRLCRNAALADDLAQETFLQAWRTLGGLREPAAFPAWLRRIALNAWLQHRRRNGLPLVALDDAPEVPEPAVHDAGAGLDLDGALAQLRPIERLCVVLAYSEGMSHGEIATAADLPVGTVKSHISRGSARLREMLEGYGGSGDV